MVGVTIKRTPLHAIHARLGAKLVPFGGYEMPVSYPAGITAEHKAVREAVGVFDVSHMGEFEVTGPDRNAFVQRVTCNDRSEEHTSELQSQSNLVCRLLLEKKKKKPRNYHDPQRT